MWNMWNIEYGARSGVRSRVLLAAFGMLTLAIVSALRGGVPQEDTGRGGENVDVPFKDKVILPDDLERFVKVENVESFKDGRKILQMNRPYHTLNGREGEEAVLRITIQKFNGEEKKISAQRPLLLSFRWVNSVDVVNRLKELQERSDGRISVAAIGGNGVIVRGSTPREAEAIRKACIFLDRPSVKRKGKGFVFELKLDVEPTERAIGDRYGRFTGEVEDLTVKGVIAALTSAYTVFCFKMPVEFNSKEVKEVSFSFKERNLFQIVDGLLAGSGFIKYLSPDGFIIEKERRFFMRESVTRIFLVDGNPDRLPNLKASLDELVGIDGKLNVLASPEEMAIRLTSTPTGITVAEEMIRKAGFAVDSLSVQVKTDGGRRN